MRAPLGFIVQLAGYDATLAEEMPAEPSGAAAAPSPQGSAGSSSAKATQAQHRKLHAMLKEYEEKGLKPPQPGGDMSWDEWSQGQALGMFGVTSRADLTKEQMSKLIEQLELDSVPFG